MTKAKPRHPLQREPMRLGTQDEPTLDPALKAVLDEAGPEKYGLSTARQFARGGEFNQRPRRRYAIT